MRLLQMGQMMLSVKHTKFSYNFELYHAIPKLNL